MNEPTSLDGRSERARRRRVARREQILLAAKKVFAQRGHRDTSVSHVIDEAGISRGTFYSYFDSKDALFRSLVEALTEQMMDAVSAVDPGHGQRPVRETYQNLQQFVDLVFDDRDLAMILFRVAVGVDADVDRIVDRVYLFLYDLIESALLRGAEFGHIREVDEKIAAVAYLGSIREVLYQFLVVHKEEVPTREQITGTLFDLFMHGLGPG